MNIGSSPGQHLIGSVDVKRMALETQQILKGQMVANNDRC